MHDDEMATNVRNLEELLRADLGKVEFWQGVEIEGDSAPDVDHEIGWAEYGRFRMLYRRSKFDRNDELIDEKVTLLIEAPEEIRAQLEAYLPLFMEAFAKEIHETKKQSVLADEDDSEEDDDEDFES